MDKHLSSHNKALADILAGTPSSPSTTNAFDTHDFSLPTWQPLANPALPSATNSGADYDFLSSPRRSSTPRQIDFGTPTTHHHHDYSSLQIPRSRTSTVIDDPSLDPNLYSPPSQSRPTTITTTTLNPGRNGSPPITTTTMGLRASALNHQHTSPTPITTTTIGHSPYHSLPLPSTTPPSHASVDMAMDFAKRRLKNEIYHWQQKEAAARRQCSTLNIRLQSLESQRFEQRKKIVEFVANVRDINARNKNLLQQLERAKERELLFKQKLMHEQSRRKILETEATDLTNRYIQMRQRYRDQKVRVTEANESQSRLRAELIQARQDIDRQQSIMQQKLDVSRRAASAIVTALKH